MDVPSLKEIQEDLEKLESMERDYHLSLEEKREYEIRFANRGNARWAEMEERCTKKRMEVGQFEQGFHQNISFYTSARCEVVKICTLKEMELIEKLKNRYGFTGSVLVDKYTFYSEKVAIITRAVNQNIAWDEEKDGPSSGYDHWTTSKLRDMDD